ncbi:MAG TPA: hypothetical protein VGE29_11475 [Prosthecobacter sp.]
MDILDSKHGSFDAHRLRFKEDVRILRLIYGLARRKNGNLKRRSRLISDIEGRIIALERRQPLFEGRSNALYFGCGAFGVCSPKDLAEIFVQQFEKMVVRPKSFGEFRNAVKGNGYRSRVRGKLFHLFVRNFSPLLNDFYDHAVMQVAELNDPTLAPSFAPETVAPNMMNAKGDEYPKRIPFCPPLRAWDICIIKKNGKRVEFVDDMYVSHADDDGIRFWSFLCELEVKTAGASGGFGKQIGFSQARMGDDDVEYIELKVEKFAAPVRVIPEHILLSPRTIDRNAITFFGKKSWGKLGEDMRLTLARAIEKGELQEIYVNSEFKFQKTKRGDGEVFRRITLAINADFFDGYVDAIWPFGAREKMRSSKVKEVVNSPATQASCCISSSELKDSTQKATEPFSKEDVTKLFSIGS